jgi:hypothetical protein
MKSRDFLSTGTFVLWTAWEYMGILGYSERRNKVSNLIKAGEMLRSKGQPNVRVLVLTYNWREGFVLGLDLYNNRVVHIEEGYLGAYTRESL